MLFTQPSPQCVSRSGGLAREKEPQTLVLSTFNASKQHSNSIHASHSHFCNTFRVLPTDAATLPVDGGKRLPEAFAGASTCGPCIVPAENDRTGRKFGQCAGKQQKRRLQVGLSNGIGGIPWNLNEYCVFSHLAKPSRNKIETMPFGIGQTEKRPIFSKLGEISSCEIAALIVPISPAYSTLGGHRPCIHLTSPPVRNAHSHVGEHLKTTHSRLAHSPRVLLPNRLRSCQPVNNQQKKSNSQTNSRTVQDERRVRQPTL